jgi:hypothetical protein
VKKQKKGEPKQLQGNVPRKNKERGSHWENSTKDQIFMRTNKPIWRAALTVSMSNKIFCCRFQSETYEL